MRYMNFCLNNFKFWVKVMSNRLVVSERGEGRCDEKLIVYKYRYKFL
jgi:hypothetical protein